MAVHKKKSREEDYAVELAARRTSSAKKSRERYEKSRTKKVLIDHQKHNQDREIREGDGMTWTNGESEYNNAIKIKAYDNR